MWARIQACHQGSLKSGHEHFHTQAMQRPCFADFSHETIQNHRRSCGGTGKFSFPVLGEPRAFFDVHTVASCLECSCSF